jgi:hypothetical protein
MGLIEGIVPASYWQRGCNAGKAGEEPRIPFPMRNDYTANVANEGYMNGWKFGRLHQPLHQPAHNEGSEC